jgi:quinol monooxygenase YgiN
MPAMRLMVTAIFKSKPGSGEQLYGQLCGLAEKARKDPGCLKFECKRNRDQNGVFMFLEEWQSQADLEHHLKMPYLAECREARAPYLDGEPQISFWLG